MASDQWYYRLQEKQLGPVDYDSLQQLAKAGVLSRTTPVWKEGLAEWVPASSVRGLFTLPPPAPAAPSASASAPSNKPPEEEFVVLTRANLISEVKADATPASAKLPGTPRRRPQPAQPATRPLYRNPALLAAATVGAVLLLGIAVHHSMSKPAVLPDADVKKSPSPTVSPSPKKQVPPEIERDEKLAEYDRAAADDKNQIPLAELQRRIDELANLSDATAWQSQIQTRRTKLQQLKEGRARQLIESLGNFAIAKADASDFQGSLQELAKFPKDLEATDAGTRLLFFRKKIGDIAQTKLPAVDASAVKLASGHDLEGALRLYSPLAHLNSQVDRMIAQRETELRDIVNVGLDPFADTTVTLKPAQQFLGADVYYRCPGLIEKLGSVVKDAVSGSPETALAQCDLAHYPRSAIFYYAHALALMRQGNTTDATWDKDQARRAARTSADFEARLQCLDIRLALEQSIDEARANHLLQKSQQIVELHPKNAEAFFVRGLCFCRILSLNPVDIVATNLEQSAKESFNTAAQLDSAYDAFATAPDPYAYSGAGGNPYLESVVMLVSHDNQEARLGTGFVVGNGAHTAYIITNHHVIDGAKNLHVHYRIPFVGSLSQRDTTVVKFLGDDPRVDLALLEIPVEHPLKALPLRNTTSGLEVPLKVTLIGHPKGLDYSVLSGELSNLNREVGGMRYLQVNANVEPGMSGGPVIDALGNVIGVTVMKYLEIEGQGLAILSERVRDICSKAGIELTLNNGNAPPTPTTVPPATPANVSQPAAPPVTQSKPKDEVAPKDDTAQKGEFVLTFKERGPLGSTKEQARRLHAADIPEDYDLSQESFKMFVPGDYDKSNGYGLIVWLDTSADPVLLDDLKLMLQKRGLLWISPKNCDSARKAGGYRIGLPVDAVFNVCRRYTVDDKRIYAVGLGPGAETATRLALLYPDVFSGGLFILNCDRFKDVPGTQPNMAWRATFTPDAQLFAQARRNGRFVLIAGEKASSREMMKSAFAALFTPEQFPNASYVEVPGLSDQMPGTEWIEKAIGTLDKPLMPAIQSALAAAMALEKQGKLTEAMTSYEIVLKHGASMPEVSEKARAQYQALTMKKESQLQQAKTALKEQRLTEARTLLESFIKTFETTTPGEATDLLHKLIQSPQYDKSIREHDAELALNNALQSSGQDIVKQYDALELVAKKYAETAAGADASKRIQTMRADHDKAAKIDAVHDAKKAEVLLQDAKNLLKNGLNDDARTVLQGIITNYPKSDSAVEAKHMIERLP